MKHPAVVASRQSLLNCDLTEITSHYGDTWADFRKARVFLTGCTGFVGAWLLESLLFANQRYHLGITVTVLTRNPRRFGQRAPHLAFADPVTLLSGDIRMFSMPRRGSFTHYVHGAAVTSTLVNGNSSRPVLDTATIGTQRVLEFARRSGGGKFLLLSSGAVYGPQRFGVSHVAEESSAPNEVQRLPSPYSEGKRISECLCVAYSDVNRLEVKIARSFSFLGPYLPLEGHFAAGNFMRDVMCGRQILIQGDGASRRSYLYPADMAAWLLTILARGQGGRTYNVGSECAVTISQLAARIAKLLGQGHAQVRILGRKTAGLGGRDYIPSTRRARSELGLMELTGLSDAIMRTGRWLRI